MLVSRDIDSHVAVLTFRRPEARNAISPEVAEEMEAHLDALESDHDVWVIVLAGEGPVFSAGADLKAIAAGRAGLATVRGGFAGLVWRERSKPMIAAVEGPALAGGCEIALACDLIVASTAASFGLPEVKRSLVAAAGGLFRLPRSLPRAVGMEMILTGEPISATRAHSLGMVSELVEPGGALAAAKDLAHRIAVNAPLAVQASRRVAAAVYNQDADRFWFLSEQARLSLVDTEDYVEGPKAFIEKRPPAWKGC